MAWQRITAMSAIGEGRELKGPRFKDGSKGREP